MKTAAKLVIKAITVVISLLAAHKLHAEPTATVWAKHPDAVRKFFPPDQYRMLDSREELAEHERSGYILPHKRDAIFHKLGLEDKVDQLDDMDKDMLVMAARFKDAAYVQKHFPMLETSQAQALVREVRELAAK